MTTRNKGKRLDGYVKDYVVFDLETTGINQERDAIIEISAVMVRDGQAANYYSSLVNPHMHIPKAATAVNGITDDMVKDSPDIGIAIGQFIEFAGSEILVGHNIHTFDTNFAYDAAWNFLGKELKNDYIDTLYMARSCLPQLKHHRLTDISEYFHIETAGAHRALNDCIMNYKCYEELGKLRTEKKLPYQTCSDLVCPLCKGSLMKRNGKFGIFYGCGNYPRCRYTRNL